MNSIQRRQSRHQIPPTGSHHYYENDYSQYYGTAISSHDNFDNVYPSHYHASSSSSYPQSFFPSHHPYPPRSRHAPEPFSQKGSSSSKKRPRQYHETNQGNSYNPGFGDKTATYPFNHNKNLHQQHYQYIRSQHNEHLEDIDSSAAEEEDDEEEEFLTPLEAEALRNAELNKTVRDATANSSTATGSNHEAPEPTEVTSASTDTELETSGIKQQDSTGATIGKAFTKKKHDKALGVLVSFFRRLASAKPHQQKKKHSVNKMRQTKGKIQTMWVSTPLGDVMDQQQQQEVYQMLQQQTQLTDNHHGTKVQGDGERPKPHDNATKVASLDHIWVFRCTDTNNNNEHESSTSPSAIWTGFDYENQIRLSQYSDDDNGIEIYDTHIRKGLFPILVIPKRQVCFYAASNDGIISDQVSSLQVACLPNSNNVQFVYRCGPPSF